MKLRTGFVSNSSSSSYVVALAKVTNKKRLGTWLESLTDKDRLLWEVKIIDVKDLLSQKERNGMAHRLGDSFKIEANRFGYDEEEYVRLDINGMKSNACVLVVNIANDEGDECFSFDSVSGELNWDIDLEFLPGWQQDLWHGLDHEEISGVKDVRKKFGAARNG